MAEIENCAFSARSSQSDGISSRVNLGSVEQAKSRPSSLVRSGIPVLIKATNKPEALAHPNAVSAASGYAKNPSSCRKAVLGPTKGLLGNGQAKGGPSKTQTGPNTVKASLGTAKVKSSCDKAGLGPIKGSSGDGQAKCGQSKTQAGPNLSGPGKACFSGVEDVDFPEDFSEFHDAAEETIFLDVDSDADDIAKPNETRLPAADVLKKVTEYCSSKLSPKIDKKKAKKSTRNVYLSVPNGDDRKAFDNDVNCKDVVGNDVKIIKLCSLNAFLHLILELALFAKKGDKAALEFLYSSSCLAETLTKSFIEEAFKCNGKITAKLDTLRATMAVKWLNALNPECLSVTNKLVQGVAGNIGPLMFLNHSGTTSALEYGICVFCGASDSSDRIAFIWADELDHYTATGYWIMDVEGICQKCQRQTTKVRVLNEHGFFLGCRAMGEAVNEGQLNCKFPLVMQIGLITYERKSLLATTANFHDRHAWVVSPTVNEDAWRSVDSIANWNNIILLWLTPLLWWLHTPKKYVSVLGV
ncbi:uncharacterized protein LOC132203847 [Neocloeon triangulifer]|uniref:uncharacterized protein LOC132203847 n=1 Tax=Neocloeon triangulifer TaxID=2078957 RepID=UPI00286F7D59|nr:uncharacterized protein LOC132203847 [Neocloeon triangulifer]XP_059487974.1 uncharacterized protein LOC132203847 [Neocloeon triangulifer]XP_059487975.1 uncharacterized protein LOC132203847 [Neocloeon triangulifer]